MCARWSQHMTFTVSGQRWSCALCQMLATPCTTAASLTSYLRPQTGCARALLEYELQPRSSLKPRAPYPPINMHQYEPCSSAAAVFSLLPYCELSLQGIFQQSDYRVTQPLLSALPPFSSPAEHMLVQNLPTTATCPGFGSESCPLLICSCVH